MSNPHRPKYVPSCLIWGGWYGSRNIGDTAILLGLKELIQSVNKNIDVYIRALSTDIDYTSTNGVTGEPALIKSDVLRPWTWIRILNIFRKPDKIIVSGGTPVFDHSHAIRTLYLLLPVLFRKPFVIFGAGIKPIKNWYGRRYIPYFLKKAEYVSVRDDNSKDILCDLGVKNVSLTADSAFFARPAQRNEIDGFLTKYGVGPQESLLVVTPRLLSTHRKQLYLEEQMDGDVIEQTPQKIAKALSIIAPKFDRVILMAMHFYGPDSDVPLIKEIMQLTTAPNTLFLDRELRPEIAIALFQRAHIVLGMRLHSLLLALSMETPTVGIAYERKVTELFKRLHLPEQCLDLFDFSAEDIVMKLERTLKDHEKTTSHIRARVSELRERILESAKEALVVKEN